MPLDSSYIAAEVADSLAANGTVADLRDDVRFMQSVFMGLVMADCLLFLMLLCVCALEARRCARRGGEPQDISRDGPGAGKASGAACPT